MAAAGEEVFEFEQTRNQLINLFRISGKSSDSPLHRGTRWEFEQSFRPPFCYIMLHPIEKPPPAYQGADPQSEGVQIEVNNDDKVKVFREVRGSNSYYSLDETEITGTVPGLYTELNNNRSFLPSLENNRGFRKVLSDFDKNWGRVPKAKRSQLYRSMAARRGSLKTLDYLNAGDGHVNDVLRDVIKVAGSDKVPPKPRCAFIDNCL